MKLTRHAPWLVAVLGLAMTLSGCAAVKELFKMGVWVGVLGALLLVGALVGLSSMFSRRGSSGLP